MIYAYIIMIIAVTPIVADHIKGFLVYTRMHVVVTQAGNPEVLH